MQVVSPLPLSLVGLSLALPGVWLAGRSLARTMAGDRTIAAVITPALGGSLWLLAIHVIARARGSFIAGLVAGTFLVSIAGVLAAIYQRRTGVDELFQGRRAVPFGPLLGAIAAMAILAPSALEWAIHDETWPTGHMSIPAQMLNGVYPPRDMNFPAVELRYHYGFDLLTAVTAALTRLDIPLALDVITIACWGYAWILLWALGERVVGRSKGALIALLTLFGGGVVYACNGSLPYTLSDVVKPCTIEGLWVNPPLTSYIFQHPWTLGLPLGLAALLVSSDRRCRSAARYVVLGVLLLLLSFSQLVLFLTLTGAILVQESFAGGWVRGPGAIRQARFDPSRALAMTLTAALVFAGARALGGFFNPPYDGTGSGLIVHLGITDTFAGSVRWLVMTYGLLLPLGLAGVFFVRRERLTFITLLTGSFLILVSVRHAHTWDIVKFATVAAIILGILSGASVARLLAIRPRALSIALSLAAIAGVTAGGLGFTAALGLFPKSVPLGLWDRKMPELLRADVQAVTWLRTRVKAPDVIYRGKPEAYRYSVWGGLPLAWIGPEAKMLGFSERRLAPRKRLLQDLPPEAAPYLEQGIRWFVLDGRDRPLDEHAAAWIKEGKAYERAKFGGLRIVELLRDGG